MGRERLNSSTAPTAPAAPAARALRAWRVALAAAEACPALPGQTLWVATRSQQQAWPFLCTPMGNGLPRTLDHAGSCGQPKGTDGQSQSPSVPKAVARPRTGLLPGCPGLCPCSSNGQTKSGWRSAMLEATSCQRPAQKSPRKSDYLGSATTALWAERILRPVSEVLTGSLSHLLSADGPFGLRTRPRPKGVGTVVRLKSMRENQ